MQWKEARTTGSTMDVVPIWSMQQQRPAAAAGKRAAAVAGVARRAPTKECGSREGSCKYRAGTDRCAADDGKSDSIARDLQRLACRADCEMKQGW
jgi:hypothetical protein